VIATDADGTGEVCVDMLTGRLVPIGDAGALRAAALWTIDNPEEAKRLALAGRTRCATDFSVGAMADGLEAVYERALTRKR
jgi:glycosyltransferase involved in cell wall biosynthesis